MIQTQLEGTPERCESTSRQETRATKDTRAHKKWGEDQKKLLRTHQMIALSTLRYAESIHGTATKPALKT
jgi:hypothetical protein